MEKEIHELNNAIRECRAQLDKTLESAQEASFKIKQVMSDSHLTSVMTWIRTDLELYGMLRHHGARIKI